MSSLFINLLIYDEGTNMVIIEVYKYIKDDARYTLEQLPTKLRAGIKDTGVVEATIGLVQTPCGKNENTAIYTTTLRDEHFCVEKAGIYFPPFVNSVVDHRQIHDNALNESFSSAVIHMRYMQQTRQKNGIESSAIPSQSATIPDVNNCSKGNDNTESQQIKPGRKKKVF